MRQGIKRSRRSKNNCDHPGKNALSLMKIIRDYILKDFISSFIFSLLSLSMIMLLGNLVRLSDMVIRKGVNPLDAVKMFLYFMPSLLAFTIPLACLLAVLLSMGRLIADNELVAIKVAGVSIYRLLLIFLILGAILSLGLFLLNDDVVPNMRYNYHTELKNISSKNINALIEPGVFSENLKNYAIYVSEMEGKRLKDVIIYELGANNQTSQATYAKEGQFTVLNDTMKLQLNDGFRDNNDPRKKQFSRIKFKTAFIDIPVDDGKSKFAEKKFSEMPISELLNKIAMFKRLGSDRREARTELYKRLSFSLSPMVLVILGFSVSLMVKHREKSINFGIAFLIAGFYYLLFIAAESLGQNHKADPRIIMWSPNILVLIAAVFLLYKYARSR
jgi:lipopolysaccharide export system permease protein